MQFDTYIYAIFLAVVFVGYWGLQRRLTLQNLLLLAASYLFYGWWDWRFLGLIAFTSLTTYGTGLMIRGDRSKSDRLWATLNIVINLGILAAFKYLNFFGETAATMMRQLGFTPDWVTLNIVLPVGISFYTFQAISYTIDLYRGDIKPTRNLLAFMVFIAFFPQLVAGPIERASNLLPQFLRRKTFDYANAVVGMRQILWGLVKKIAVADVIGEYVNYCFTNPAAMPASTMALASLAFGFQIYADFSGYSDIAIGSARLFNIKLNVNFRYPYFSRSFRECWRHWHISLTSWFTHYVYFPLGGSRRGHLRTCFNTMVVFTLSGLWHGASWHFVLWGVLNGLCLLPSVFTPRKRYTDVPQLRDIPRCIGTALLFIFLFISFRAASVPHWLGIMKVLLTGDWFVAQPISPTRLLLIVPLVVAEWLGRRQEFPLQRLAMPRAVRWAIYWVLLAIISVSSVGHNVQYIYFQF